MTTVSIDATLRYLLQTPADILLAVEAIPMDDQKLIKDLLKVTGSTPLIAIDGMDGLGQRVWLNAGGQIDITYTATVELDRPPTAIAGLNTVPLAELPPAYIQYLMPSRYCPSDKFENFVSAMFDASDKGAQVLQMADWIYGNIAYVSGSSGFNTTASDIFLGRQGVCRDFAHLLIAFARAASIPARMVSAYALGLVPPDFHAVVEVYLDGNWHLVDATRLVPETNLIRIAVGRDATDVGFMTIFGSAQMLSQTVMVSKVA